MPSSGDGVVKPFHYPQPCLNVSFQSTSAIGGACAALMDSCRLLT
jgi:hypothetical protein